MKMIRVMDSLGSMVIYKADSYKIDDNGYLRVLDDKAEEVAVFRFGCWMRADCLEEAVKA